MILRHEFLLLFEVSIQIYLVSFNHLDFFFFGFLVFFGPSGVCTYYLSVFAEGNGIFILFVSSAFFYVRTVVLLRLNLRCCPVGAADRLLCAQMLVLDEILLLLYFAFLLRA